MPANVVLAGAKRMLSNAARESIDFSGPFMRALPSVLVTAQESRHKFVCVAVAKLFKALT